MLVSQLLQAFRIRVDDRTEDFLWPDDWFIVALNEAVDEACIRARLLSDSTTPAICQVTTVADQMVYQLDPRVIDVDMVKLEPMRCGLELTTYERMIELQARSNGLPGRPLAYAIDGLPQQGLRLLLDRPMDPAAYPTFNLSVKRLPLQPLRLPAVGPPPIDDTPEINPTLHRALLHWVAHLAYDTRDADAGSAQRSAEAEARFEARFGKRQSAKNERVRLRHEAVTIQGEDRILSRSRLHRYRPFVDPI